MNTFRRELLIDGRMANLPEVVEFVEASSEQAGVDDAARFDLQLAVEEACTNIIQHAYHNQGGPFFVAFEAAGRDVLITIRDQGQPFDPGLVAPPDLSSPLEERQIGGLGLHLMQQLMDEVRFSFTPDGNTLVMIKRGVILPARWSNAA